MNNSEPQPELFALAAALYQQQRDYDNSIRVYQRALQMQPQQSHWWMGIGISLEGAGKPSEAKSAYEEAIKRGALTRESRQYVEQRLSALH
jgi:MSHA biogenesis protein MshN